MRTGIIRHTSIVVLPTSESNEVEKIWFERAAGAKNWRYFRFTCRNRYFFTFLLRTKRNMRLRKTERKYQLLENFRLRRADICSKFIQCLDIPQQTAPGKNQSVHPTSLSWVRIGSVTFFLVFLGAVLDLELIPQQTAPGKINPCILLASHVFR